VNNSQMWSNGAVGTWQEGGASSMFDNDFSTFTYATAAGASVNFTELTANTSIKVFGDSAVGKWNMTINGSDIDIPFDADNNYKWKEIPGVTYPASVEKITSVNGNGRVYAIAIDGVVLSDPNKGGLPGAVGNELKRTWKEWNGAALLRMSNPQHVAAFNAVEAAIQEYPAKVERRRDELRGKLRAAGLTAEDITTSFSN